MRKLLGITIGTMLLATILYGQPRRMAEIRQEIWKDEIKRFKIKSVTAISEEGFKSTHFYDDYGNLSRVESDSANGKTGVANVLIYDNARQLIEKRIINSKGQIYRFITYSYNPNGLLIKMEWTNPDRGWEATWTYEYDRNGNKIKENQESILFLDEVTKFKYVRGRLAVSESSNEFGKGKKVSYTYNRRGLLTKEKMIDYSWYNSTNTLIFSYNDAGKLVTLTEKDNGGGGSLTTYQYNEKGLLESEIWEYSLEAKSYKTTYIVAY